MVGRFLKAKGPRRTIRLPSPAMQGTPPMYVPHHKAQGEWYHKCKESLLV
jgi:hypothetical protein